MPGTHRYTRARILVAGVLGTATLLVACNSDRASRITDPTARTTSTVADLKAAVLADYRAFWDAYLAVVNPMSPGDARLTAHAAGEELQKLNGSFLARKSAGEVIKGSLDLAPVVVDVAADQATVRDCYLDRTQVFDASGSPKAALDTERQLVTVRLILDSTSHRWKVANITHERSGCTSAS